MMNVLSVLSLFLLIGGGILTYFSEKVSSLVFKGEDRDESKDNLKTKMIGFLIALTGAAALFILKK